MITEEQAEKAIWFIRDNAEPLGHVAGRVKGLTQMIKAKKAEAYLEASGTVAERQAVADCNEDVIELIAELENAEMTKVTLETLITARKLVVDAWRTEQASSRI